MSTMDHYAATVRATHPYPSADPLDRLRHTVSVCAKSDADSVAVMATSGIYPPQDCITADGFQSGQTGLTHGDLRELLRLLGADRV